VGIRQSIQANHVARTFGNKVMLGSKTESSLGVTAIAHLVGLADFLDLDGHISLSQDPFQWSVLIRALWCWNWGQVFRL